MYDFFLQGSEKTAMGMGFSILDPTDSLSSIKGARTCKGYIKGNEKWQVEREMNSTEY
jgi:hypothetical protein